MIEYVIHMGRSGIVAQHLIEEAGERFNIALKGKKLVLLDRFGSAYRNVYYHKALSSSIAEIAVCNYDVWGQKKPAFTISQERKTKTRRKDNANHYDRDILEELKIVLKSDERTPVFETWYETDLRRSIVDSIGGSLLCVPKQVRAFLEDKSNFDYLSEKSGIFKKDRLKTGVFESFKSLPSYSILRKQFGNIFVIQGESMGGSGISFIRSEGDFRKAAEKSIGRVRVAEYFEGQYSSTSVLTVPKTNGECEVYIDLPTHKTTDIPEVGVPEIMGAGNEYSVTYSKLPGEKFIENVNKVAKYAYKNYGLVGVWALEGFIEGSDFYLNEINCRPVGGTEVSSANQLLRNFPPFIVLHNLIFLKQNLCWLPDSDDFNQKTIKAITGDKNRGPFYLKIKAKGNFPVKLKDNFSGSGVYRLNSKNELEWVRAGQSTLEADFDKGEVLVADAPLKESVCFPSVELCTLEGVGLEKHIFKGPRLLTEEGYRLSKAIYKFFDEIR